MGAEEAQLQVPVVEFPTLRDVLGETGEKGDRKMKTKKEEKEKRLNKRQCGEHRELTGGGSG